MRRLLPPLVALLLWTPTVLGQPAEALSDSAFVSVLTVAPGDQVYSLFGHSAFRIADPGRDLDRTYNFGTFDFNQPHFILRFARGQLDYMLDTAPYHEELWKYQYLRRPMIEQRLDLPPETVRALYERLEVNQLPENREYRYDFFFDNCSTRMLDALDEALVASGQPRLSLPQDGDGSTFRDLLRPYVLAQPALWLGMTTGLGLPADRVATARETTFLPDELLRQLDTATVDGRPLVASSDTVLAIPGYASAQRTTPWPLIIGWLVFLVGVGMTVLGRVRSRTSSRPGWIGDVALFAVVGFAGLFLALLWFGTEHAVTGPNLNLLWAWPTHLFAAWGLRKPALSRLLRRYLMASGGIAALTSAAWFVLPQALPAALLPLALLVALRSLIRAFPPTTPS